MENDSLQNDISWMVWTPEFFRPFFQEGVFLTLQGEVADEDIEIQY